MTESRSAQSTDAVKGRWTIRWQPFTSGSMGGYKVGGREPWPSEDGVPVVPCDDAAVERAAWALREHNGAIVPLNRYRKMARIALTAAGASDQKRKDSDG